MVVPIFNLPRFSTAISLGQPTNGVVVNNLLSQADRSAKTKITLATRSKGTNFTGELDFPYALPLLFGLGLTLPLQL